MLNAKKKGFIFIVTASILISCISNQKIPDSDNTALYSSQNPINKEDPADDQNAVFDQLVITPEPELDTFDPQNVSIELKETTFFDAKALIQKLNAIIQAKNYSAWLSELSPEYFEYYSSTETLNSLSESPVLRRQGISLHSLHDYFLNVVYPSRQNDRVDDIEFITPGKIRVIIITPKGERLVLYNLEKINDIWKIAYWR